MIELFQSILTIDLLGAVGIGLLGGLMHGYTGWGGAMVMMPLMSVLYGPVYALAIILMGGIMVSVQLFPWAIRRVDWREMTPMFIAIAVSIPGEHVSSVSIGPNPGNPHHWFSHHWGRSGSVDRVELCRAARGRAGDRGGCDVRHH